MISNKEFKLEGVSGFDGSSLGLGGFIEACKRGEIVKGESVLAIEAPDRVSRAEVSKTKLLWHTLQKDFGIDIAIQRWGVVFTYDKELDLGNDLMLTAAFHLARMESEQKSQRIKATINIRREQSRVEGGKKRSSVSPAWLKISEDRKSFEVIPEKVKLLNLLFELKLNKGLGPDAIARRLNKEGIESLTGGEWSRTTIRKYLKDAKCVGTFQPQTVTKENGKRIYVDEGSPIEGYYPCVVDKDVYLATQQTFRNVSHGRKGRFTNLFKGLTACSECGSKMQVKNAKRKGGKEKIYLKCNTSMKGDECRAKAVPYDPVEETLVKVFSMFDYSKLQGNHDTAELEEQIKALKERQASLETQIDIQMDNASKGNDLIRQKFIDRANNLSTEQREVTENLATLQTKLIGIATSDKEINLEIDDYDSRQRFNKFIQQYVSGIEATKNWVTVHLLNTNKSIMFEINASNDDLKKEIRNIYKVIQGDTPKGTIEIGTRVRTT